VSFDVLSTRAKQPDLPDLHVHVVYWIVYT